MRLHRAISARSARRCFSSAFETGSLDIDQHKLQRPSKPPPKLVERTSLVAETLATMEKDEDFQLTAKNLKQFGQKKLTLKDKKRLRRSLEGLELPEFDAMLEQESVSIKRISATVLQMNIGLYCNQACNHCHVESSPKRTEMMSREVADRCLELLRHSPSVTTVDITGGAPELCDQFRYLAAECSAMGKTVMDRCNLTVLSEPGQEDLPQFLADHNVHVVASLPCYSAKNVNQQRGKGVFGRSIDGLLLLNEVGYGTNPDLQLDLVYNPLGGFLPPDEKALEVKYKEELKEHFGIDFNHLFAFANMPIKRFADFLWRRGELKDYMELLVRNFNPATVDGLMCANTVSVGWDGHVYDCDFNQQLDMTIDTKEQALPDTAAAATVAAAAAEAEAQAAKAAKAAESGTRLDRLRADIAAEESANALAEAEAQAAGSRGLTVFDMQSVSDLLVVDVLTDNHCYGCTAGMGSS